MANKYIDSKDVVRTQDGKIDLFQTILARKDPTAQIPVIANPRTVTSASRTSPTNSNNNSPSTNPAESSSSSSSGSSLSWRATHVTPSRTSASESFRATSSPYTSMPDTPAKSTGKKTIWSAIFVGYCNSPDTIPNNVRHWHDDNYVIIKDAYPKAKIHMLVMPRTPVDKVTDLVGEPGILVVEGLVRVATTLLSTLKTENPYLDFKMGFHVIPSMRLAPHWNSFNTSFFVTPDEVIRVIREKGSFEKTAEELIKYTSLKKAAMTCNQCSQVLRTIPMLTHHLNEHYVQRMKALQKPERLVGQQGSQ
ncbi:hypothetical protein BGZ95_003810 [Linnemannia exigua]|uniref:C2H2-type domain-containing protein n=1 Tax=Linnemannia exigua TaxID=604196 RepID=A0AAD4D478_9FUNG|nr:hypothetical protein BGZ95_003810 [Linnemannia exigua]